MTHGAARLAAAMATVCVAGAPAVVGWPDPSAGATDTICVALVADFTHIGGGISSRCARVPAGSSGSDVLRAAGHRVTFDPRYGDDFVCAIDGKPAGGCSSVDGTHYWAYYHRAPNATRWTLSSEGSGTYQPRNASTEGWVYDDGSSSPPQPRNVPYGDICPRTSTSRTAHATASPRSTTSSPASSAARATATPRRPRAPATATPAPYRHTTTPRRSAHTEANARTSTAAASGIVASRPPPGAGKPGSRGQSTATPFIARRAASSHRVGDTGLVAGVALVAVLGGAAAWRARRGAR